MPEDKNQNQGGRQAGGQRESSGRSNPNEPSDLKERVSRDKEGSAPRTPASREMPDKD